MFDLATFFPGETSFWWIFALCTIQDKRLLIVLKIKKKDNLDKVLKIYDKNSDVFLFRFLKYYHD